MLSSRTLSLQSSAMKSAAKCLQLYPLVCCSSLCVHCEMSVCFDFREKAIPPQATAISGMSWWHTLPSAQTTSRVPSSASVSCLFGSPTQEGATSFVSGQFHHVRLPSSLSQGFRRFGANYTCLPVCFVPSDEFLVSGGAPWSV